LKDEERKAYFDGLSKQYKVLEDLLRTIVFSFVDKKLRRIPPKGYPLYEIRDSILYRFGSLWFHMDLLLMMEQGIENYVTSKFPKLDVHDKGLLAYSRQQLHLFEDIIFHTISIFDYMANLIGFLYLGNNKGKIKWNGISNAANDKNGIFKDTKAAELIRIYNKALVDLLYSYRSTLIHHTSETANATYTLRGTQTTIEGFYRVWCPDKFGKSLGKRLNLTIGSQNKQVTLVDIAACLIQDSANIVNELAQSIKEEKELEWMANTQNWPGVGPR